QAASVPVALAGAGSLGEGRADAEVVVVGGGSVDRTQVPAAFWLPLRFVAVGSSGASNLAVAGLNTRVGDGRVSALARVVNYGSQPRSVMLVLRVDGTRFDARSLSIDAGSAVDAQWDDLPAAAHTLEARLDQS